MSTRINTSPLIKTYTLEEFWQLPDPPDRSKLELIAGVLYMSPPPGQTHDRAVKRLNRFLVRHLDSIGDEGGIYLPRAAIWTSARTYLEPDLFYVSAELEARLDPDRRTTADFVVEVISPGSAMYDRNTKADTYAALGVRELWLVDETARTVEVRLQAGGGFFDEGRTFEGAGQVESTVFPRLVLRAEQLFAD